MTLFFLQVVLANNINQNIMLIGKHNQITGNYKWWWSKPYVHATSGMYLHMGLCPGKSKLFPVLLSPTPSVGGVAWESLSPVDMLAAM